MIHAAGFILAALLVWAALCWVAHAIAPTGFPRLPLYVGIAVALLCLGGGFNIGGYFR